MHFLTGADLDNTTGKALVKTIYNRQLNFQIITDKHTQIHNTKNYIAEVFQSRYGAHLEYFMPMFLQMSSAEKISGAVGIRPAGQTPLFLEQYLEKSSEHVVSEHFCQPVCRSQIVEIGNLVATRRGSSYLLFLILAKVLHAAGFHWMLFTATRQVEQILLKMHFSPLVLCEADPRRVMNADKNWGSYYQSQPRVMAGNLSAADTIIKSHSLFNELLLPYRQHIHSWAQQIREAQ